MTRAPGKTCVKRSRAAIAIQTARISDKTTAANTKYQQKVMSVSSSDGNGIGPSWMKPSLGRTALLGGASFQSQLLARRKQADRLLQPPRFRFLLLSGIDPTDVH